MGLSLDQMAAMLGVNPRTVRSWESGRDRLSASSAAALLDLVGRHVELVGQMVAAGVRDTADKPRDGALRADDVRQLELRLGDER
jgi:transcriptional regulator with XRE-family HTH domain